MRISCLTQDRKEVGIGAVLAAVVLFAHLKPVYAEPSSEQVIGHEREMNQKQGDLSQRVRQEVLDQLNPVRVAVSTQGITTLQFPVNIQAVDGDGFQAPSELGNNQVNQPTSAQFSVSPGPNWVSVKALREGVRQNLNVMLKGRVYPIVLDYSDQHDYAVLFSFKQKPAVPGADSSTAQEHPQKKQISTARLLGFLDKIKAYPTFSKVQPAMYIGVDVNEPGAHGKGIDNTEHLQSEIKRVLRDDALDAIGFEIELSNKTNQMVYYDPEGFAVRVGQEVYQQTISDAPGKLDANAKQTVYFVIAGSAVSTHRNDLSVYNDFSTVIREVNGKS
jgi:hypothetical protein